MRRLINKPPGNAFVAVTRIRLKLKYNDNLPTTFGAVTKIRPIIIITLGTTNVVFHNGYIFGAGIGVNSCDCDIVTDVTYQDIFTVEPYPITVLHLVPEQDILPYLIPDQTIVPQTVTVQNHTITFGPVPEHSVT